MQTYSFHTFDSCPFCESKNIKVLGKRLNKSQGFFPKKKIGLTTTVMRCHNCEIVFPNPLPIPNNIQDHYGIIPEQYWKPDYFIISPTHLNPLLTWMNCIQPIPKGGKILDIGAGLGKSMIALTHHGYDAYGIEPSNEFHQRAIQTMGVSPEKLQCTPVEKASYPDNYFDAILMTAVLEHVYHPKETLQQLLSWVKPGGIIYLQVPSSNWLMGKLMNLLYLLKGNDYVANLSPMHEPFHLYEFSKQSFKAVEPHLQFKTLDYKYFICDTYMPKILQPLFKTIMKQTDTGMEIGIWIQKK